MVTQGNETCVELHGVTQSGFTDTRNTICVKGTWYPLHFLLLITDGIDAWRIDATENVVTLRSRSLRLTESEYVDKAHLLLGQQHSGSVYSLHRISSETVRLMCTPTDKQYTVGFSLDLVLKMVPAASVIFDMLQFLMRSHGDLLEQVESKTRMIERTKAAMEKNVIELHKEKQEVESPFLQQRTGWDEGAMIALSPAVAKRKGEHAVEKKFSRKKPQWSLPSTSPPLPPPTSKAPLNSNGIKGISNPGSKARRGVVTPTKISNSKQSISEPKYRSWGAQGKFSVGNAGSLEEEQTAEVVVEEEEDEEEEEEETDRDREKELIMAAANVEGCLEQSRFPGGDLAFTEHHHRLMKTTHPGRTSSGTPKRSRSTVKRGSSSKLKKGGTRSSLSRGVVICPEQIEEQVAKGIKLLAPFTNSGSPCGQDQEERSQQTPLSKKTGRLSASRKICKQSSQKNGGSLQLSIQVHNSEEVSPWSNVSLQATDARQFGMLDNNLGIAPVTQEQRKFNVLSADINDFDGERTEKAMALNQFWALYDDKDGMPRFYGRISKLIHSPFEVNVEWLEPHRPVVRSSGLVKSANLSVSCGEFKLGIECPQLLAAFSHRVEMDVDAPKSIFRLYPRKHEVWALYRNWSKPKPEQTDAEEEDNVKFEYELVELHSDYSKEKGIKVAPLYKVPGFLALFKSGGPGVTSVIPAKDVFSQFSHQIFTYQMHGDEKPGVPKGSWELDPAATPPEYLKESTNGHGVFDSPDPEIDAIQTVSESG